MYKNNERGVRRIMGLDQLVVEEDAPAAQIPEAAVALVERAERLLETGTRQREMAYNDLVVLLAAGGIDVAPGSLLACRPVEHPVKAKRGGKDTPPDGPPE